MPDPALPPQPQVQQDPIPDTSAQVSHSSAKYVEPSKRARKKVQIFMSLLNKGKGDGTIETETVEPDPLLDDDIEETAPHRVRERLFLRPKDYKSGDPIPGFPLSLEHSKAVDENDTTRFSTWTPSSESFLRVSASQITPLLNTTFSPVVARPYALYLRVKSAQEARQEARFKACISVYYDVTGTQDETNWRYLPSDTHFKVRAHHGKAHVMVTIRLDESKDWCGNLWVRSLELVPSWITPLHSVSVHGPIDQDFVTQVATSKDGKQFAALRVFGDKAVLYAWPAKVFSAQRKNFTEHDEVYTIHCPHACDVPLEIALSDKGEYITVYQAPKIGDWRTDHTLPRCVFGVRLYHNPQVTPRHESYPDSYPRIEIPLNLQQSVGYATFAGESKSYWRSLKNRFVFCNGLYLNVFDWRHNTSTLTFSHSIPLTDFRSILWRTVACELAVRSIVSNMFIWVTENGRHCSTWDFENSSNLGRIDIGGVPYDRHTRVPAIKVACNENIIAIVGFDNSITTVDASSGIIISRRILDSLALIENIAFPSAHSDALLVFSTHQVDRKPETAFLDALCLNTEAKLPLSSILSHSSVFYHFGPRQWPGVDSIYLADAKGVVRHTGNLDDGPLRELTPRSLSESPPDLPYKVEISTPASGFGSHGSGECQVDVWKCSDSPPKLVFSFIPEPWNFHQTVKGFILSTRDRFVILASRTIQLWSLPTPKEQQRCKLIFFWSRTTQGNPSKTTYASDIEFVLSRFDEFTGGHVDYYLRGSMPTRFMATRTHDNMASVELPTSPLRLSDITKIKNDCIQSTWLLALTHTLISSKDQNLDPLGQQSVNEAHAGAIIDFVSDYINHSEELGIMRTLLATKNSPKFSVKFIDSLLQSGKHTWIPGCDSTFNPIRAAIDGKIAEAPPVLLNYCTRMARRYHPLFLAPVEECFKELICEHPEPLRKTLRSISHLPAQGIDFDEAHVIQCTDAWNRAVQRLRTFSRQDESPILEPVLAFRSLESCLVNLKTLNTFPKIGSPKELNMPYQSTIYVVPFPSLVTLDSSSNFHTLAGRHCFDNADLKAILCYKTWQFGWSIWGLRLLMLVTFYGIFLTMATQIPGEDNTTPSTVSLGLGAVIFIAIAIFIGCILLLFEIVRLYPTLRIWSRPQFNLFGALSVTLTLSCLCAMIQYYWTSPTDRSRRFGAIPFAIITTYLHLLSEIRVSRRFGTIVNILVLVVQKAVGFIIVFVVVVAGFTHSFIVFFHASPTNRNARGEVVQRHNTDYPVSPISAFATTLFFLAGRYDAINGDFKLADAEFLFLIMFFYFIVTLCMLTMLIALMSDAFNRYREDGENVWLLQLSKLLADQEVTLKLVGVLGRALPKRVHDYIKERSVFRRRFQVTPTYIFFVTRGPKGLDSDRTEHASS